MELRRGKRTRKRKAKEVVIERDGVRYEVCVCVNDVGDRVKWRLRAKVVDPKLLGK